MMMMTTTLRAVSEGVQRRSPMGADDRKLAAAALKGDEAAFSRLVERHSGGLHRTVARILCDEAEAWDVVQMAFLKNESRNFPCVEPGRARKGLKGGGQKAEVPGQINCHVGIGQRCMRFAR